MADSRRLIQKITDRLVQDMTVDIAAALLVYEANDTTKKAIETVITTLVGLRCTEGTEVSLRKLIEFKEKLEEAQGVLREAITSDLTAKIKTADEESACMFAPYDLGNCLYPIINLLDYEISSLGTNTVDIEKIRQVFYYLHEKASGTIDFMRPESKTKQLEERSRALIKASVPQGEVDVWGVANRIFAVANGGDAVHTFLLSSEFSKPVYLEEYHTPEWVKDNIIKGNKELEELFGI